MMVSKAAVDIANRLESACGLDVTPNAIEAIEEGLVAMHTEKDLQLASNAAVENEREHDLAIWWEAYLQLLASVARNGEKLNTTADYALADYRAKREKLLG